MSDGRACTYQNQREHYTRLEFDSLNKVEDNFNDGIYNLKTYENDEFSL